MYKNVPEGYWSEIETIKSHGFNLIAVGTMVCETTFYFPTQEEAIKAYNYFEKKENPNNEWLISGWWYGKDEIESNVLYYSKNFDLEHKVYFI